jgi:hypothetical protein
VPTKQQLFIRKQSGTLTGVIFDLSVSPDYTRKHSIKTENIAFFLQKII